VENENEEYTWSEKPDIEDLQEDLARCRQNLSYYTDDSDDARDLRFSIWAGKNKRNRKEGTDAWPWVGASDTSVGMIDQYISEDIALFKRAITLGNLKAIPTEPSDIRLAQLVTDYLKWTITSMDEFYRESTILASNVLTYGSSVLGVYWKRKVDRYYAPISLEEIAQQSPDLAEAIIAGDDSAKSVLQELFPNMKKRKINKVFKQLSTKGVADIPRERMVANRPCIKAYEIGREIIFDSNVMNDIQNARSVYCLHHHTPESLREMVITEGYDSSFVDEVIKSAPAGSPTSEYPDSLTNPLMDSVDHDTGLIQLVTCYRKVIDDDGIPLITQTIFAEQVEGFAKHEVNKYGKGVYPFTIFCRETINHRILDSRGVPDILRPYEQGVKVEQDMRIDRASLSTVPPLTYLTGRKPESIGPGSFVPVRRQGEVQYMDIPAYNPASTEVENFLRLTAKSLMGRPTGQEDVIEANLVRQERIMMWLDSWRPVLRQIWHLQKTYAGPEGWNRVLANEKDIETAFDDVSETFDFHLTFDANTLDQDKYIDRLKVMGEIFSSYDRKGQANYGEFMRMFAENIDPAMADRLIAPEQEATDREVEETSQDIAKISSGQVVQAPQNANTQLRMQVMQSFLQGTKEIPATDVQNRMQTDEGFKARIEQYVKGLEFVEQQRQNALIGRLGTPQGNAPATSL
jgi:hypothetical protein